MTIRATDPKNPKQPPKEARLIVNSYYDDPGVQVVLGDTSGSFSRLESSRLVLGAAWRGAAAARTETWLPPMDELSPHGRWHGRQLTPM